MSDSPPRQRADQELDKLLYLISHDLSAPVRHVREFSRLLMASLDIASEKQQAYREYIEQALVTLDSKLDALHTLSRVASSPEEPSAIALAEELEAIQRGNASRDRGAIRLVGDLPDVFARLSHARQIMEAVIDNAFIHSACANSDSENSDLENSDRDKRVEISALRLDNDAVEITVSDNGPGIDPQHHDAVFELFRRLNPQAHPEGLGLGLTLARKMARHNGGDLRVAPGSARGTSVVVTLPST